ncbi:MAG: VRR-NUC domain-containing protein [Clostridiaceae bacterium]
MSESTEQQALFEWAEITAKKTPELKLLFAVPNGGKRNITTAVRLKKEGVKSGVPDICLPVPCGGFHGLYIEMKVGRNKPAANQIWWIGQLRKHGYRVDVCYSWGEAVKVITEYMIGA